LKKEITAKFEAARGKVVKEKTAEEREAIRQRYVEALFRSAERQLS
jgi:hypothetical protein